MDEEKQHINPWADKLQDISLPEEGLAWEGMSAMLSNELPQAKKKDNRRWVLLIILLLLLLGVCNCPKGVRNGLYNAGNTDTTSNKKVVGNEEKSEVEKGAYDTDSYSGKDVEVVSITSDSIDKSRSSDKIGNDQLIAGDTIKINKGKTDKNAENSHRSNAGDKISNGVPATSKSEKNADGRDSRNASIKNYKAQDKKPVIGLNTTNPDEDKGTEAASKSKRNKRSIIAFDSSYGKADAAVIGRRRNRNKNGKEIAGAAGPKLTDEGRRNTKYPNGGNVKQVSAKPDTGDLKLPASDDILGADSEIVKAQQTKRQQVIKDSVSKADSLIKATAVAKKDSLKTDSTKADKKKQEKEKNKENGWVAGVGLNQFFAISGQERSTLNSDGVTGTWKDYLPVPQLRYYFNRKLYIQLEAQFNAPQYTQTLLGKFVPPDTSGNGIQTSVFVKKLFYFNLPLSVHYSPFKNFYLGTGIQFSRLSNSVGTVEQQRYSNGRPDSTGADIKTQSLKGDSLYKRIATNEFRWLVDANYHLKNFTLGVRYNQAFSNFINIQVSSTQLTQARNSSLQVYLRYTFWRSKRLKEQGIY